MNSANYTYNITVKKQEVLEITCRLLSFHYIFNIRQAEKKFGMYA
jgi:hypothetical protein